MKIGTGLRNMGSTTDRDTVRECAQAAEAGGIDSLWVFDHIAIPPDDAEGSGGLYLDPLATLAFIAGCTERIELGTGVLVLPYRPPLATAKWLATIQVLAGNRLLLGAAPGWMEAEFKAVGAELSERGRITDATLAFIHDCFGSDLVTSNGQEFLFKPRPARPRIYIGGKPPHAINRALEYGDGWIPIRWTPERLAPAISEYRERAEAAGKERPEVITFTLSEGLEQAELEATVNAFAEAGVDRLVCTFGYTDSEGYGKEVERLQPLV